MREGQEGEEEREGEGSEEWKEDCSLPPKKVREIRHWLLANDRDYHGMNTASVHTHRNFISLMNGFTMTNRNIILLSWSLYIC